jgi:hypothetical protein
MIVSGIVPRCSVSSIDSAASINHGDEGHSLTAKVAEFERLCRAIRTLNKG